MSKQSISIMNSIIYEFPILLRQVAIKILAAKSDFSCSTWNKGDLLVKVFFLRKLICVFRLSNLDEEVIKNFVVSPCETKFELRFRNKKVAEEIRPDILPLIHFIHELMRHQWLFADTTCSWTLHFAMFIFLC